LDAAALVTVGYWHYLAAVKNGVPAPSRHTVRLTFSFRPETRVDNWKIRPEPPPTNGASLDIPPDGHHFVLYPQMARRTAEQGDVTLRLLVRAEGYISDAQIVRSSGFAQLDAAALISVGYWDYLPKIVSGKPVDSWRTVTVHLSPTDVAAGSPTNEFEPKIPVPRGQSDNGVSRTP